MSTAAGTALPVTGRGSPIEVLRIFLRLGLTSFGGPVAHLGYFRVEFVERRRWLDEGAYADIVALCQFLPGPASSQTGISIGILRAGLPGAFFAWLGFTAPSALAMILFGYGVTAFGNLADSAWLHGLKIVAVAVVAQAVWGMARNLCPDRERATIAVGAAMVALAMPSAPGQIGAIAAGGLIGWGLLRGEPQPQPQHSLAVHLPRAWSVIALVGFFALLVGLPLLAAAVPSHTLALFDSFYRSGALVFGGGHVVLAAAAGFGGAAGMGDERRLSRRLWRGASGAGAAVHLCRLSRHGHGSEAQWLARRSDLCRGDISAVISAVDRRVAVLGHAAPPARACNRRCAASMRRSWVCCWRRSTSRCGRARYSGRPISRSAFWAFLLLAFWAVPPWLVVIFGAVAATVVSGIPMSHG